MVVGSKSVRTYHIAEPAYVPDGKATLPAHCVKCQQPVSLTYYSLRQTGPTMYSWICPYPSCGWSNTVGIHGSQPSPTVGHHAVS